MSWRKGQSGNPAGRKPIPIADSLAATIRRIFDKGKREQAIARLAFLAIADGVETKDQLRAFELLARYGWPEEKSGAIGLRISGKHAQVLVQHVHQPIGIAGQAPVVLDVVDVPAVAVVDLARVEHAHEGASPGDDDPLGAK